MTTGIVYNQRMSEYVEYPECAERLTETVKYLGRKGYDPDLFITPQLTSFSHEEYIGAHSEKHVKNLIRKFPAVKSKSKTSKKPITHEHMFMSANSSLKLGESFIKGHIKNGISLSRPPGHHMRHEDLIEFTGTGFCYLNNAAILTKYLQKNGYGNIMIVDWDAHHGNGTEEIFYQDSSVLYSSIHESPLYPGTGDREDVGIGDGEGFNINIPVLAESCDIIYQRAFDEILIPVAKQYSPEVIVVSAGYDSCVLDPLTLLCLIPQSYHTFIKKLQTITPNILVVLEGGYNVETLPLSVHSTLCALENKPCPEVIKFDEAELFRPRQKHHDAITLAHNNAKYHWDI